MREFMEDYGEFIALAISIGPIIATFLKVGAMIGRMNFGG